MFKLIKVIAIMSILSNSTNAAVLKKLPLCPDSPNCVSSQAPENDKEHYIEPFKIIVPLDEAWTALKNSLSKLPRTLISKEADAELEAQVTSLVFRFVDDVHIVLDKEAKLIHIRSASRSGYSDLGVNRKRVENLRRQLQQIGIIE